jgi:hypothetical protein
MKELHEEAVTDNTGHSSATTATAASSQTNFRASLL